MEIRGFQGADDVPGVIRAHGRAWRTAYAELLPRRLLETVAVDPSPEDERRWLESLASNPDGVFVALEDGSAVGFVDVRWGDVETKPFVGPDDAELRAIYVDPDHWGAGVGTALLERGLEALPAAVSTIRLEMLAGNEVGKRFYEARGFERTGTNEIEFGGDVYETDVFTKRLSAVDRREW